MRVSMNKAAALRGLQSDREELKWYPFNGVDTTGHGLNRTI